jgi:hypothetical protein
MRYGSQTTLLKNKTMKLRMSRKLFIWEIARAILVLWAGVAITVAAAVAQIPQGSSTANPRFKEALAVQKAVTPGLMSLEGILGTAIGADDTGQATLVIFVNSEGQNPGEVMRALPRVIQGVAVIGGLTDPFRAFVGKPGGGTLHTAKQTPPIQLGTSGGWGYDLANGYCCGGTLGSLININGEQYILSNYHVFESDIVTGGNNRVAEDGSPVIQPGLIDVSCSFNNAQTVATLVKKSSLPNSNVDVGVAKVTPGAVDSSGAILEIGTISAQTVGASINQAVKKSGRTTGLTRSQIAGLNATITITYENECAGGTAFTKVFTGQIVINNKGSRFLAGGDSGSLMVEDVATNPRAVGLLYAGSSSYAIANPIGEVLNFLGATMVGK